MISILKTFENVAKISLLEILPLFGMQCQKKKKEELNWKMFGAVFFFSFKTTKTSFIISFFLLKIVIKLKKSTPKN